MQINAPLNCCYKKNIKKVIRFNIPPKHEPDYSLRKYLRYLFRCTNCSHVFAAHNYNFDNIYKNNYSLIAHGNNLFEKLKSINKLGKSSDNFHRVKRVIKFLDKRQYKKKLSILDIGAGFGVFLYNLRKKKRNWKYTAIEPDINNFNFLKQNKFKTYKNLIDQVNFKNKYDLITLNKVLEHLKKPDKTLRQLKNNLSDNGLIYLEVPDSSSYKKNKLKFHREEFFVDHLNIFSIKSLKYFLESLNFKVLIIRSLREKSGKYTIYCFLKKL